MNSPDHDPQGTRAVLIVDDDRVLATTVARAMKRQGCQTTLAHDRATAVQLAASTPFDLVLLDIELPDGSGLELIDRISSGPGAPAVVVVTGRDDLEATVEAIQRGALECLVKPLDLHELVTLVERVFCAKQAKSSRRIEAAGGAIPASKMLVGKSAEMRDVFRDIARSSRSKATVLITGETGVGKEVVARAIHESSALGGEFVGVNCAALSPSLFEAELFGHARGAFTGADRDRPGRIDAAAGGLLFLDEIGELTLPLQAKMLRFLQEHTYERVGETRARTVDARIVAATNRDLQEEVRAGRFREDLFYRLQVVVIRMPPLRRRAADFGCLLDRVLAIIAREAGLPWIDLDADAERSLLRYPWPGNVRELVNALLRVVLGGSGRVALSDVQPLLQEAPRRRSTPASSRRLEEVERDHIAKVLADLGWVKRRAAVELGISRARLDRKIAEFGLAPPAAGSSGEEP